MNIRHVFQGCCTGPKTNGISSASECAASEEKIKYCFLLENKKKPQPQLLHAHILEQKPQVKYDVNTSSSCFVQKKPGVGNHIECSKIKGREERNKGERNIDSLETALDSFIVLNQFLPHLRFLLI